MQDDERPADQGSEDMPLHSPIMKYLESVAEFGTIRKSARQLHVASSSINRQILALEAELGVRLFERIHSGVRLTPAGELLIEHVRRTNKDFETMLARMRSLGGLQSGHLAIATVPSLATTVLPSLVSAFRTKFPGITFDVRTANSVVVVEALAKGQFDIGFSFNPPSRYEVQEHHSINVEVGCVLAADHPLAEREPLMLGDCLEFDLILPGRELSTRLIIDRFFQRQGIQPTIHTESDSLAFIKALVARGAGIGLQPNMALEPELSAGQIIFKRIQDGNFEPDRLVVVTGVNELSPAADAFLSHSCDMLRANLEAAEPDAVPEREQLSLSGRRLRTIDR
jgi:DNA-binding transcriptional LysR family regulator